VLHTFRAALPHMRAAGRGNLVALVSRNAELCPAGLIGYNASKAAVIASVRTLSRELDGSGIVVNGLVPGPTLTEMNPAGTRPADSCFPTARMLCTLPSDGPTGRTFFDEADYPVFSRFSTP
jgi:NAD(P)-dependent dehydrogenase (short-subunit alcohol dehydrogenase family)